jgi:hypothetical protein
VNEGRIRPWRGKFFREGARFAGRRGLKESASMPVSEVRLAELAAMPDSKIDTSDIPEVGEAFFKSAKLKLPRDKASK